MKSNELDKLERYTAYCILLKEMKDNPQGICVIWYSLFKEISWLDNDKNLKHLLPELWEKRTSPVVRDTDSWFEDDNQRIEALKECIKETHP